MLTAVVDNFANVNKTNLVESLVPLEKSMVKRDKWAEINASILGSFTALFAILVIRSLALRKGYHLSKMTFPWASQGRPGNL